MSSINQELLSAELLGRLARLPAGRVADAGFLSRLGEGLRAAREMVERHGLGTVGEPTVQTDPEDDAHWWIQLPVTCQGEPDAVLDANDAVMEEFAATVGKDVRAYIHIHLRTAGQG